MYLDLRHYFPTPRLQTRTETPVARTEARRTAGNMSVPNMAMLVNVAKIPPAGVNPPYMKDWNPAANDPVQ